MEYEVVEYGDIAVSYTRDLDGGGRTFGQAYIPFVRERIGRVDRVLEWCAGPGFIGFSMLAEGICESLDLMDVNADAVVAARRTVERNGLSNRVRVHHAGDLDNLPDGLVWDLVVGNPPHAPNHTAIPGYDMPTLIYLDPDWAAHRRFYRAVRRRLCPGGSVLVQENSAFSQPGHFIGMIEESGLHVDGVHDAGRGYYWIWSRPLAEAAVHAKPYVAG